MGKGYGSRLRALVALALAVLVAASPRAALAEGASWDRLWGQNAYGTMERVLEADGAFPDGRGGTVCLATGDGYWDALAGSGLAGLDGAPVLITPTSYLRDETAEQLERLAPSRVVVLGGPAAVADLVLDEVRATCGEKCEVTRVYGDTARDTAREAYESRGGWGDTCVVATWTGYWDALSIAPYAWARHAPIFLTDGRNMLDDATLADVQGFDRVVIGGGTAAVSGEVEGQLAGKQVVRLAGENAVKTSAEIAKWELGEGMTTSHMCVATGDGYWDALCAAPLAGAFDSVLAIMNPGQTQAVDAVYSGYQDSRVTSGHVIGGPAAVSEAEWDHLTADPGTPSDPGPFADDAGTWTVWGTCEWRIADNTLYVRPVDSWRGEGTLTSIEIPDGTDNWWASFDKSGVTKVERSGTIPMAPDSSELFAGFTHLTDVSALAGWDTTAVTNMEDMFGGCTSLVDLSPLAGWDTSHVINMGHMFVTNGGRRGDLSPLAGWDTSNVTNMSGMFQGWASLTDLSPLAGWDTSHVTNMSIMFDGCTSLTDISPLASWDISAVTNIAGMFEDCTSLTDVSPLAGWDTSHVVYIGGMFYGCKSLKDATALEGWDVSQADLRYMVFDTDFPTEGRPSWAVNG